MKSKFIKYVGETIVYDVEKRKISEYEARQIMLNNNIRYKLKVLSKLYQVTESDLIEVMKVIKELEKTEPERSQMYLQQLEQISGAYVAGSDHQKQYKKAYSKVFEKENLI